MINRSGLIVELSQHDAPDSQPSTILDGFINGTQSVIGHDNGDFEGNINGADEPFEIWRGMAGTGELAIDVWVKRRYGDTGAVVLAEYIDLTPGQDAIGVQ